MARILVVDDEIGIRELLFEILYDEGHTVELAENAAQARAARLRMRPDLVLLDILDARHRWRDVAARVGLSRSA
jgi:Response regulator containing CheY-like receiver, AAA-type ATPase, and DNA-binding domains